MTAISPALSASMENYLEAIFLLIREHAVARSKEIADRLKVNASSVTGALQSLKDRGLVHYEPYGFVTLTQSGEEAAAKVLRRHEVLRDFFVNVLSIDSAEADETACRLEHGISKGIVDRLVEFAEFVDRCPRAGAKWIHGFGYRCAEAAENPGDCERCVASCLEEAKQQARQQSRQQAGKGGAVTESVTLKDLKPGEKGRVEKVSGEGAVKRRIRDMGMTTGSLVEVVRVAPLGDPIDVKLKGYHLSLRKEEAKDILVARVVPVGGHA